MSGEKKNRKKTEGGLARRKKEKVISEIAGEMGSSLLKNKSSIKSSCDKSTLKYYGENRYENLVSLAEALLSSKTGPIELSRRENFRQPLPSLRVISDLIEDLRALMFPGYFGDPELNRDNLPFHLGATLDRVYRNIREQILRGLCFNCRFEYDRTKHCSECEEHSTATAIKFMEALPELQRILWTDARAAYEGDPACSSPDEAIFCYPGLTAVTCQRLAHELWNQQVPLIPRIMTEWAHSVTGIDIHPGASIGESFFIDHGTGVVIGETCIIGKNVRLYQGVTLGAKSFPLDENGNPIKGIPRHPIVEDDVIIYSGATILGRITIGKGSVIGGNVWLTRSVPPGTKVTLPEGLREMYFSGAGGI